MGTVLKTVRHRGDPVVSPCCSVSGVGDFEIADLGAPGQLAFSSPGAL